MVRYSMALLCQFQHDYLQADILAELKQKRLITLQYCSGFCLQLIKIKKKKKNQKEMGKNK